MMAKSRNMFAAQRQLHEAEVEERVARAAMEQAEAARQEGAPEA